MKQMRTTTLNLPADPTSDLIFKTLAKEYISAELVAAVLVFSRNGIQAFENAFSCLRFSELQIGRSFAFLTPTPLSLKAGSCKVKLIVTHSNVSSAEAEGLVRGNEFVDPRAPGPQVSVASPGMWFGPEVVGLHDSDIRSTLPAEARTMYVYEKRHPLGTWEQELGARGLHDLTRHLQAVLGIDFERHAHRLRGFSIAMPCVTPSVRCASAPGRRRMGVEIRGTNKNGPCTVTLTEIRVDRPVRSQARQVTDGLHVFSMNPDFGSYDFRVYGPDGILRHTERFFLFRQMRTEFAVEASNGSLTIEIDGESISQTYNWSRPDVSWAGTHAPRDEMERIAAARHDEKQKLTSGQVSVFDGGPDERARALATIRKQINNARKRIWIIDPYFSGREVVDFLTAAVNPSIEIRLIVAGANDHLKVTDAVVCVNDALSKSQSAGFTNLAVRASSSPLHDRFLAVDDKWWLLGASLNSIGSNVSTMVLFPAPNAANRLFLREWERSGDK